MNEMAKFPYLTRRKGSQNWYYKRDIDPDLWVEGRQKQIWRSLRTPDRKKAEATYATKHVAIEQLIASWRAEDDAPRGSIESASGGPTVPLTPALLRRVADAHYLNVYDNDFEWRGNLWKKAHQDEEAFWRGEIIEHPKNDVRQFKGQPYSYYAYLMEEPDLEAVFLYCVFRAREARLQRLRGRYKLGDCREHETAADELLRSKAIIIPRSDRSRLLRKLISVEIKALEDLTVSDESSFDGILDRYTASAPDQKVSQAQVTHVGEPMSVLVERYLEDTARDREWPRKTVLRKRGELREFVEIVGDKPVNGYTQDDGVKFKDVQMVLPANRLMKPFRGLSLPDLAKHTRTLRASGNTIELLDPMTVKDKINTASLFFAWAKSRDSSVANPVDGQGIKRPRNNRKAKKRHPWTKEELNKMFAAPIFAGCHSESRWRQPGNVVLRQSAMFWVPLLGLFSGMRLGEIIQMQVADVKTSEGIICFDVTPMANINSADGEGTGVDGNEVKSIKTGSSRRAIPVHTTLLDIGFGEFVESRRNAGASRLFADFDKSKDNDSWSAQFSSHFARFCTSIGVTRREVTFHSLRHNVEDALRNADVRKEVRDAVQGHSESGISREYGSGYYVKTLNEAVQKIKYDGLDLSHLIKRE